MTTPPPASSDPAAQSPALAYALEQQSYYDQAAIKNRRGRFAARYAAILLAGLVTILPALGAPGAVITVIGALTVALVAVEGLHQWSYHWMTGRLTAEKIRQEVVAYRTASGPYADNSEPDRTLAERVQLIGATENAGWAANQTLTSAQASQVRRPDPA